jgi:collagenase-like PrtC family protease
MVGKKYSIGYQLPKNDSIPSIVRDFEENISEVYFAFPGDISGRTPIDKKKEIFFWQDIDVINKMKVDLVILFNAACYGEKSMSKQLINDFVKKINLFPRVKGITTSSPFIAKEIKKIFPELEIRASTYMRIGTIHAMEYLKDYFDGFYIHTDNQRNIEYVKKMSFWCKENKKKLHILVNHGCLYNCPFQFFHVTNLAHLADKSEYISSSFFSPCHDLILKRKEKYWVIQGCWIRPEDVHNYEPYFDTIKLATRIHNNPRLVVESYIKQKYSGNILELMEPSFSDKLIIDNQRFPKDWAQKTGSCMRNCESCMYCKDVFTKTKVN